MGYFQVYFDINFQQSSTVIREQTLHDFIPSDHEIFTPCFMSLDMFQSLLVYSLWELESNLCSTVM